MRSLLAVLTFVALTFFSWGIYGPVLHQGQFELGAPGQPSSLRPLICVGLAYFLIAVVVPIAILSIQGETGKWTAGGTFWSLAAGAAGAMGALGIVLAFKFRGSPVYVMPLVFGGAPVVNTFVSMWMGRSFRQAGPIFFVGVLMVAIGAAGVMYFKPTAKNVAELVHPDGSITIVQTERAAGSEKRTEWTAPSLEALRTDETLAQAWKLYARLQPLTASQRLNIGLSIALTALCWGCYGPVLHKGQMKMAGSRLRPLLCVGLSYFAIAVIVPTLLMPAFPEPGGWNSSGVLWSMGGGAAGAVGALGIILAFNFGGKPVYVMPLVFGCAPVVNTTVTVLAEKTASTLSTPFFVSLTMVIAGAATVLVFQPRPQPHGAKPSGDPPSPAPGPSARATSAAAEKST